ncbi:MAG: tRNA (adenosine(37)-N6)-threonylcarbamoyltransferase complex ATPase subunit type 1 TsaE [Actinobacteria bacterium]|nr:tRNA (adenosine(37)-N6)-threonylcarbamoyltransferase complex ATPase subunit type 1 TsaE [Actinomycetota bacterium]
MKMTLAIETIDEMEALAQKISSQVRLSDLLLLEGPLGAGKTFFAQTLIHALGVREQVTSPTFVMVKNYRGIFPINHIDAYRLLDLSNPQQAFEELDIDIDSSLTIVEWGKQFDLTGDGLHIAIEIGEGESRTLTITGSDTRWSELVL